MKVFKFKKPKKVNISFLSSLGFSEMHNDFIPKDHLEKIPPLSIEMKELTFFRMVDFPCRKLIFVDFLETVYPLILWKDEEYEEKSNFSKQEIYDRIDFLINSENQDNISKLFDIIPSDDLKLYTDQFDSIQKNQDYSFPINPDLFIIQPKRPIFPPLLQD